MNLTTSLMQSEWTKALGWTFVHSLWQIALIGIILFVLLRLVPGRSAHTRYTISTLALWLIVVMSLSTFIIMLPAKSGITEFGGKLILAAAMEPLSLTERISAWLEVRMPMMLTIWSGGVTILMIRLLISLGWVRHMRSSSIPEAEIQVVLDQIIQRLRLKVKPGAAGSGLVSSPVTIGHLKPLILFPVGIINQLAPNEVEAVLTHELAHIVRRDYLSNLVQSVIETLFYYHPITWWISSVVRTERENRADDLAVSWCGDHLGYAKALLTVQEMQIRQGPALAIGFASGKGAMLARIQRILNLPYKNHNQMEKTVLLSLTSLCFLAFTLTSHTPANKKDLNEVSLTSTVTVREEKMDTLPQKGIYRIHKKTDNQDIEIQVEDGNIKALSIDGKEIEPSKFETYGPVVDDLFGEIEAPRVMEGYEFNIPPMPPMPPMPSMPGMPPMPPAIGEFDFEMPDIDLEQLMDGNSLNWLDNGSGIALWKGDGLGNFKVLTDTTMDGMRKIVIINGGDSTVVFTPQFSWTADGPASISINGKAMNEKEFENWAKELEQNAASWNQEWSAKSREQADQLRKQQQEWRIYSRGLADQSRAGQDQMRSEIRHQQPGNEQLQRDLEWQLNIPDHTQPLMYEMHAPRLSLSDQIVRDGLVAPGAEVRVQLTPDKLKINGEKMPESIHEKYLKLYEAQQGVELTGNSRVEFTTKSKQRM